MNTTMRVSPFKAIGAASGRASARPIAVRCQASSSAASRRDALLAVAAVVSPLLFLSAPASALLLPDDDDEDLVNKAKANRKTRLVEQRGTTRQFMQSEGLSDKNTDAALAAVERAVVKLTQSGAQLEKGDLTSVAAVLSEPWVAEFEVASKKVSAGASSLQAVLTGLTTVRESAAKNDITVTKKSFVALVAALESWTEVAGIKSRLPGL